MDLVRGGHVPRKGREVIRGGISLETTCLGEAEGSGPRECLSTARRVVSTRYQVPSGNLVLATCY